MNENILIVDDEVLTLELLGLALERAGYTITVAREASEAMKKVLAEIPDLIILDVMLPGVSGLELCAQLRARTGTKAIPILMLSAKGEVGDKIAGLRAGADEYVVKPLDVRELIARVESLLERVSRLRAEPASKAGKVISFVGAKGGVGTTTTVVNVGMAMATPGKTALVVEFRPYPGSFPTLLGLPVSKGLGDLLAMEAHAITPQQISARLVAHPSGLKILCAPQDMNPEAGIQAEQADALVEAMAFLADYVLIDLAPYPLTAVQAAARHSAAAVLVVEPVRDCLLAASVMAEFLKTHLGSGAALSVILVNRAPMASPVGLRELQSKLGLAVAQAIPPAVDESARAQLVGMPVVQSQPDSFAARAYQEIAAQLL
jgi:DNA-binding response OmpR family regulator